MALYIPAETATELVNAHMPFAETGYDAGAPYFFKFFVNLVEIVVLGYFDLDTTLEVVGLFKRNLHKMNCFYVVIMINHYISRCKINPKNPINQFAAPLFIQN
jgi:hypothetical protein